jgi:hypothetical protein
LLQKEGNEYESYPVDFKSDNLYQKVDEFRKDGDTIALSVPNFINMTTVQDEQDAPWKKILRQYFQEALEFFFPEIAQVVDWTKPIEFLDKEFMKIAPDAKTGKRFADQLVKVYRRDGQAIFLLIHVEIQASRESGFAQRIFTYSFRIFDYFDQPATSVMILCDSDPKWRPQAYNFALPGTKLSFEFSAVKLLDYRDR